MTAMTLPALPWLANPPSLEMAVEEVATGDGQGLGADVDPGALILTCANCGAPMDDRKCKLICRCGYFLSCSDYY